MRKPILIAALALLTACGQATTSVPIAPTSLLPSDIATMPPAATAGSSPTAPATGMPTTAADAPGTERSTTAIERLAARLNTDPANLKLISAEAQEWSDSSLGCPDASVMYMQVITPGYLLVFEDGSQQYRVHTDAAENGQMVLCENGTPQPLTETGGNTTNQSASAPTSAVILPPAAPTTAVRKPLPTTAPNPVSPTPEAQTMPMNEQNRPMVERVQEQAAQQTNVDPSAVRVISVESVEWSDGSLGCPQPGAMYLQVITPGYRVVVEVDGTQYAYHTDRNSRIVYCAPEGPGSLRGLRGMNF